MNLFIVNYTVRQHGSYVQVKSAMDALHATRLDGSTYLIDTTLNSSQVYDIVANARDVVFVSVLPLQPRGRGTYTNTAPQAAQDWMNAFLG